MNKINLDISKKTSLYMKGVAILFISMHNIIHKLPLLPIENEFSFSRKGFDLFFSTSFFNKPVYFLFSFLGHYGVQVFIFLSAYAFYLKKEDVLSASLIKFYKSRFFRMFKPVLLSVIVVSILNVILRIYLFDSVPTKVLINSFLGTYVGGALHLLAIKPFLPEGLPGGLGPWWFISFILQFYILLPFLLKIKFTQLKCFILIISSIVFNYIVTTYKLFNFNIFYTVIGHIPEIIFAFYYSEHLRFKKINPLVLVGILLLSTGAMLYCNSNNIAWFFGTIPSTISFLSLLLLFKTLSGKEITNALIFVGQISIYIFLLNGITRSFFIPYLDKFSVLITVILIIVYLLITILISYGLMNLEERFKLFQKKPKPKHLL